MGEVNISVIQREEKILKIGELTFDQDQIEIVFPRDNPTKDDLVKAADLFIDQSAGRLAGEIWLRPSDMALLLQIGEHLALMTFMPNLPEKRDRVYEKILEFFFPKFNQI